MTQARYSHMSESAAFGFLANALDRHKGGDGDTGAIFPRSDAEDMSRGASFVPGAVTSARRAGRQVRFVTECGRCCWYWEMPEGTRIYHFDPLTYDSIGRANGRVQIETEYGPNFKDGAGPCPHCGNPHTMGGEVTP